jgi:heme/copper-type cytochrome/quinol oxidase subunit 4
MNNETDKKAARRESLIATVIVAIEFLTWLFVTLYFFSSRYSEVSDLTGYVLGFPAISFIVHLVYFLAVPRRQAHRREVAKYALFFVLFFTIVGYIALVSYMLAQPYK